MEIKNCVNCNGIVLPGLDYTREFNQKVRELLETKNKMIPSMAKGRLRVSQKQTGSYRKTDYRTGREIKSGNIYDIKISRPAFESIEKKLYCPSISGPLCEVCCNQCYDEIQNVIREFSLQKWPKKVSKIERTISSYNKSIEKVYKRWIKK